jgi:tRNA-2-methylthio-N6-dimethylallyladenosine synthase
MEIENGLSRGLKYYIETFGCQMNEYDTELVRSILNEKAYVETSEPETAEVILLNTCSVRENAHNRVFGRLQRLQKLKAGKPVVVGVLGCMAQNLKLDLLESSVYVDLVAGPDSYRRLPAMINDVHNIGG